MWLWLFGMWFLNVYISLNTGRMARAQLISSYQLVWLLSVYLFWHDCCHLSLLFTCDPSFYSSMTINMFDAYSFIQHIFKNIFKRWKMSIFIVWRWYISWSINFKEMNLDIYKWSFHNYLIKNYHLLSRMCF